MKPFRLMMMVWLVVFYTPVSWAENEDQALFWQALQEGGKVVLLRHAEIDRSIGSSFVLDDSCFEERNLNAAGKAQATKIGQLFQQHQVKLAQVLASPHCRTQETAALAFQQFRVAPELRLIKAISVEQAKANLQQTRALISNYQGQDNLVLVTHRPNIGELIYLRLEPAEMAVLQPLGEGEFDLIARLRITLE